MSDGGYTRNDQRRDVNIGRIAEALERIAGALAPPSTPEGKPCPCCGRVVDSDAPE